MVELQRNVPLLLLLLHPALPTFTIGVLGLCYKLNSSPQVVITTI